MELYSKENLDFTLFNVLQIQDLNRLEYFGEHDLDSFRMALDMGATLANMIRLDDFKEADRRPPVLEKGKVTVHPAIHAYVREFSQAGLIGAGFSYDRGGFQFPKALLSAIDFLICCRSNSFIMFTDLAKGIADLIATFGTEEQKSSYLPEIFSGRFLGTMCLTETESGSSLANIRTKATRKEDGSYSVKGQKIFISAGDHDVTEQIIHLVLARIEGAPEGTKGISLFIVPKCKPDGSSNDVSSLGMYHKMGQKATPAMHLEFGGQDKCTGFLLGTENKGLEHMFQMMNSARLNVGAMGVAMASAAYCLSLAYAKERKQGKRLDLRQHQPHPVEIINHPDVRRMLMQQKTFVEGALSLVLQCGLYLDIQRHSTDVAEQKRCGQLLDILTPIVKTYGAEKGLISVNQGLQVLGGYGYTEDFHLEQLARDVRILSIYEGTTGIQALTLLGRQVVDDGGEKLKVWFAEVKKVIDQAAEHEDLRPFGHELSEGMKRLDSVREYLSGLAVAHSDGRHLADAVVFMEFFGTLTMAWQWLKRGVAVYSSTEHGIRDAEFFQAKKRSIRYFFKYEMPQISGFESVLLNRDFLTLGEINELMI